MADDLREIIDLAKREMTDVPPEVWARFESLVRINFGAQKAYIAAQKKGRHLAILESAAELDAQALAEKMGVGIRRIQQLKKLR